MHATTSLLGEESGLKGYRAEIDGLRAVAVLAVVLFHFRVPGFSGGYLGVDVFFVISGFLITGIIVSGVESKSFSFRGFYVRRVRRIVPMLVLTAILSMAPAAIFLSPKALRDFGTSAVAAAVSASNILFFKKVGYFDTEASLRPLLHTWSLGVEEQFYLLWPVALVWWLRYRPRRAWVAVAALGLVSLALMLGFQDDPAAIFYLTPFRVWEFIFGASVLWLPARLRGDGGVLGEGGWLLGFSLLLLALLEPPGPTGGPRQLLMACIGTAQCIHFGRARLSGFVLRNPVPVFLGKISYSIYLLHWPVYVFLPYLLGGKPGTPTMLLVVTGVIGASALTWRHVELPFRRSGGPRPWVSPGPLVLASVMSLALVSLIGADMFATRGWLWRFPPTIRRQIAPETISADEAFTWRLFDKLQGHWHGGPLPRVVLIGDSQAADFLNIMDGAGRLPQADVRTIKVTAQCQPLLSFDDRAYRSMTVADRRSCRSALNALRTERNLHGVHSAILAFQWDERGLPFIRRASDELRRRGVDKVFVVGRKSQGLGGPDILLEHGLRPDIDAFSAAHRNALAWQAEARLRVLRGRFALIDLMPLVCPTPQRCTVLTREGDVIFFDGSHVSPAGARYMGQALQRAGLLPF